jgi:hypothetical protein
MQQPPSILLSLYFQSGTVQYCSLEPMSNRSCLNEDTKLETTEIGLITYVYTFTLMLSESKKKSEFSISFLGHLHLPFPKEFAAQ